MAAQFSPPVKISISKSRGGGGGVQLSTISDNCQLAVTISTDMTPGRRDGERLSITSEPQGLL